MRISEHKNNAAERAAESELRMVEMEFGRPILYVKDVEIGSEIKKAGDFLKEKGIDVKKGYFKGGSFNLSYDLTVEGPEEHKKNFIFETIYGERIKALVDKLNGEWKSKLYKQ